MEISSPSRKILRELCTDSRTTVTKLAKKYGIPRNSVKGRITALEKELGLHYTLELDYERLHFTTLHILRIKFSKKPKSKELKPIFTRSKIVQLAITTKGDFDMVVVALARDSKEYFKWEFGLWIALSKYGLESHSSEVIVSHLGFVPINDDSINECKIDDNYKKIILCLNSNSRMTMRELSKKIGLSEGLTKYYIKKLDKEGIIKRYTTVVTRPPLKYGIVYFVNYAIKEGVEVRVENERRTMYWKDLWEFPIISEFQFMWSTTGGDTSFTWACYDNYEEGIKNSVTAHRNAYKIDSPTIKHAIVDQAIKGVLPLRNIDTKENYDTTLGASME